MEKGQIKASIQKSASSLFNLTMMQIKEMGDFSFKQNIKKSLLSLSFFLIGFAAVTAICFVLIYFAKFMKVFDFNGTFPTSVLVFIFSIMFFLSLIFTTISLVKSLYFSRDNFVLLTLPTTSSIVFTSKLLVHYVNELKKNARFLIPLFIAYVHSFRFARMAAPFGGWGAILTHIHRGMRLQKNTRIRYFQSTVTTDFLASTPLSMSRAASFTSSCIG